MLLVETTRYAPASPLFWDAAQLHPGVEAQLLDEDKYLRPPSLASRAARKLFGVQSLLPGAAELNSALLATAKQFQPDVVLIVKGADIAPQTLQTLKAQSGALLANVATDDPFNTASSSESIRQSIALYDIYFVTKRAVMHDIKGPRCQFLPFAYKPGVHFHEKATTNEERAKFECDVAFIGGCDQDRAPYFEQLIRELPDLKLALYGGYWNRNITLRKYHRGFAVGRDYRLAVSGAKIVVNLVRRANRDGHVMRTFEVPAMGGFMLNERTAEHAEIFGNGVTEAVGFNEAGELIAKVKHFLSNEASRIEYAAKMATTIRQGAHTYADRFQTLVEAVRAQRSVCA